jgi:hypothetical protein
MQSRQSRQVRPLLTAPGGGLHDGMQLDLHAIELLPAHALPLDTAGATLPSSTVKR